MYYDHYIDNKNDQSSINKLSNINIKKKISKGNLKIENE